MQNGSIYIPSDSLSPLRNLRINEKLAEPECISITQALVYFILVYHLWQ